MMITIDNLDGLGALDYSSWVSSAGPLRVKRTLNSPSTCGCVLDLNAGTLRTPVRKGRIIVARVDGTVVFTGYLAIDPERIFEGMGVTGAAYRIALHAISDEWLLDRKSVPSSGPGVGQNAAAVLTTLTSRVGAGAFPTGNTPGVRGIGIFQPQQNKSWSENAGALADSVYAAYRVVGGVVSLQPAGAAIHVVSDEDGSLELAKLQVSQARELANDVTVSGEREPGAYISESFAGDGTTSVFHLSETPFRSGSAVGGSSRSSAGSAQLLADSFDAGSISSGFWTANDPGSHLSFMAAGLHFNGGNGSDGQTTIEAIDVLEVGGGLVLELGSVRLESSSDGVLCGLYEGNVGRDSCFAGYNVRQSNGSTIVVPLVNGVEVGVPNTLQSGHAYSLRVRVHSVEMQRVRQIFYAMVDGAVRSFGGGVVDAPVDLMFDLRDMGSSSNTPATVLYAGTVQSSPSICSFAPLNSIQMIGSIGYCRVTQTGSASVTKVSAAGVRTPQIAGSAGEGVDCTLSASGAVTFFAGRVPRQEI